MRIKPDNSEELFVKPFFLTICLFHLLQFMRSPWKQIPESLNCRGDSFNLIALSEKEAKSKSGNPSCLTSSKDYFPWGDCTVADQVSKWHWRELSETVENDGEKTKLSKESKVKLSLVEFS